MHQIDESEHKNISSGRFNLIITTCFIPLKTWQDVIFIFSIVNNSNHINQTSWRLHSNEIIHFTLHAIEYFVVFLISLLSSKYCIIPFCCHVVIVDWLTIDTDDDMS